MSSARSGQWRSRWIPCSVLRELGQQQLVDLRRARGRAVPDQLRDRGAMPRRDLLERLFEAAGIGALGEARAARAAWFVIPSNAETTTMTGSRRRGGEQDTADSPDGRRGRQRRSAKLEDSHRALQIPQVASGRLTRSVDAASKLSAGGDDDGNPTRRCGLVTAGAVVAIHASGPIAVYARVDKVVIDPPDAPATIQIWGVLGCGSRSR